jgi:hypothetical protein
LALSQAIIDLEFREILFERIISTNAPWLTFFSSILEHLFDVQISYSF